MGANVNDIVANVIVAVLGLLMATLMAAAANWVQKHSQSKGVQLGLDVARIVVSAVEQMAGNYGWDNAQKRAQAVSRLKQWSGKVGIQLTDMQITTLIEQAVRELKIWQTGILAPLPPIATPTAADAVNGYVREILKSPAAVGTVTGPGRAIVGEPGPEIVGAHGPPEDLDVRPVGSSY